MRKVTQYSAEFKEKLLAKAFSPNTPGIEQAIVDLRDPLKF